MDITNKDDSLLLVVARVERWVGCEVQREVGGKPLGQIRYGGVVDSRCHVGYRLLGVE